MIAGIDIGGTKTHVAVKTPDGRNREQILETSSWRRRQSSATDAISLVDLILTFAGDQPHTIVVGSHGCDTDKDCLALQALVAARVPGTVLVVNDSELLLPAAAKSGISVIAGTGSIAVSRSIERKMISAGGWGWLLGDEGSASGLVRDAARAVRFALDGGGKMDALAHALIKALDVSTPVEFGRALSDMGSAARIGSLAPLIFEAAEAGSLLAGDVINDGGDHLAILVEQLVKRGATGIDVVTAGGVISKQDRLFKAFEKALARRVPTARLSLLDAAPVTGALMLAEVLAQGRRPETLPLPHVLGKQEADRTGRAA
jgi:N-acetylglucosamine kinase-like BadF-type ATPase